MHIPKTQEPKKYRTAADLRPGERGIVTGTDTSGGTIVRRLKDLGMTPGCIMECVGISPLGDPAAYRIRGAVIALRKKDAVFVSVMGEND